MITVDLFNTINYFPSVYFQFDVVMAVENSSDETMEKMLEFFNKCTISHSLEFQDSENSPMYKVKINAQKCTLDAANLLPLLALFFDTDVSFTPPTSVSHNGNGRFSTFIKNSL
jgi:hypothetical protein